MKALLAAAAAMAAAAAVADPAANAIALEGDAEYGEYLAAECLTCHQASGHDDGIPSIIGMRHDAFIRVLVDYRLGARENPVMQTVSRSLGDDELAALAAYFAQLDPR